MDVARLRFAVCLAAVALAGCSSSSPSCVYPAIAPLQPALAYPATGATGISTDLGTVLLRNADATQAVELQAGSTTVAATPTAVPSPLPGGLGAGTYAAQAIPALQSATTYAVLVSVATTSGCPMQTTTSFVSAGSFTTQ